MQWLTNAAATAQGSSSDLTTLHHRLYRRQRGSCEHQVDTNSCVLLHADLVLLLLQRNSEITFGTQLTAEH